jgi:ABC-2 type transport system ATP-binding protein
MIDDGRAVLYGALDEIRSGYKGHAVWVDAPGEIPDVEGVAAQRAQRDHIELVLDVASTPQQVLKRLVDAGVEMDRFEVATPSLHEIFLQVVDREQE